MEHYIKDESQQAAIIQNGFNNAAQSIRDSAPQPNFIAPVQPAYPSLKGSVIDPVYIKTAASTTHYIGDSSSIPISY